MSSSSPLAAGHPSATGFAREHLPRQHVGPAAAAPSSVSLASAKTKNPAVCPTDDEALTPRRARTRSWNYVWRSGVAGGVAGCAAKTMVAPLDRVKILFQASNPHFAKYTGSSFGVATAMRDIYLSEGATGLFRGHSATLLRIFPYAGIKFLAYEQIRARLIPRPDRETPLRRLLSGSLAGVTSVLVTYPLEVIRVRLAFETKRAGEQRSSLGSICRRISNNEGTGPGPGAAVPKGSRTGAGGIANFYRGFSPTLLGMLPYAGMSFLTHDTVSDALRHPSLARYTTLPSRPRSGTTTTGADRPAPLRSWAELTSGGIAGLISQTCSYPLEVIRRRMQVSGAVGDGHRLRVGETARLIFRERGPRGFFVGLTIGYVKVVPMVAVSFYTYERMKLLLSI